MGSKFNDDFMNVFYSISSHVNRYEVFSDFVRLAGYSLYNAFAKNKEIEDQYMNIIVKYSKEDANKFTELLCLLTLALEDKPHDFLGNVFSTLNLGNIRTGQYFTPDSICDMMVKITMPDIEESVKKYGFISIHEPSCGCGGIIIACYKEVIRQGFNPNKHLYVDCIDIDPTVAMACYVQLSLLMIPARVTIGDSLTLKFKESFITPAVTLFNLNWDARFEIKKFAELIEQLPFFKNEVPAVTINSQTETEKKNSTILSANDQLALF